MKQEVPSLLKDVSKDPFNSKFAKYKFENFKKKQIKLDSFEFPKRLSADFTKMLLESTSPAKVELSPINTVDDGSSDIFEYNDDASFVTASTKLSTNSHPRKDSKMVLKSSRPPFSPTAVMHGIINSNKVLCKVGEEAAGSSGGFFGSSTFNFGGSKGSTDKKAAFFKKICALCNLQFPKDAITSSVIFKHIVDLRRRWDPLLVSDKVQILEQNMSMYNLVPVCVFCSQYFDPEYPDGIAMPLQQPPQPAKSMFEKLQTTSSELIQDSVDGAESLGGTSGSDMGSRPGSRLGSPSSGSLHLSRRGTVLTPVRVVTRGNRSRVHLIPGMDTRFEIGNNFERLGSPEVRERRDHAKSLVNFMLDVEKEANAEEEAMKHRIKSAPTVKEKC